MQKYINYSIKSFAEEKFSSKQIRNVLASSRDSYWESNSEYAILEITFDPQQAFSIVFGMLYLGLMSTINITAYIHQEKAFSKTIKVLSGIKNWTVSSSQFKLTNTSEEFNSIKLEFQRIDSIMKINYILLQQSYNDKNQSQKKTTIKKTPSLPNLMREKALQKKKNKNQEIDEIQRIENTKTQECNDFSYDDSELNSNYKEQQLRLQLMLNNNNKEYRAQSPNNHEIENKFDTVRSHTNSYRNLLSEHIICCFIADGIAKDSIIDLVQAAGGCYIENFTDFCSLIICDEESILLQQPSYHGVKAVPISWLLKTVNLREVQPIL